MGKRHQTTRRRSYGRRLHELRQRSDEPGEIREPGTGATAVVQIGGRSTDPAGGHELSPRSLLAV